VAARVRRFFEFTLQAQTDRAIAVHIGVPRVDLDHTA
jgi:hypothetical protein